MKGCLTPIAMLVGVIFLALWFTFYNVEVHCRITIEVQDGDQIKTGSSVIGLLYNINPGWADFDHVNNSSEQRGYAPTVDLGDKGLLVMTFGHATRSPAQQVERNKYVGCEFDDIGCLPFAAYHVGGAAEADAKAADLGILRKQKGQRDLPFVTLPLLIRLGDSPKTSPSVQPDDLAAQFGPGVSLKRVTLELTNDRVTQQPSSWPQWAAENPKMLGTLWGVKSADSLFQ
jgi:hypothetical protein